MGRRPVWPSFPCNTRVTRLCDAVRAEEDWTHHILEEGGIEWALSLEELEDITPVPGDSMSRAPLSQVMDELDGSDADSQAGLLAAIQELQDSARRIRKLDDCLRINISPKQRRSIDFEKISEDVCHALKYARASKYAIRTPGLKADVGAFVSHGIIPPSLHRELTSELDMISSQSPKDFYPGSNCKVQPVIDPSLYALQESTSVWLTTARLHQYRSHHVMVPSVFRVSEDGKDVHIESYINGLGPRECFPTLYWVIERVFLLALPHFERTLDFKFSFEDSQSPSVKRWLERDQLRNTCTRADWDATVTRQAKEKARALDAQKQEEDIMLAEARRERMRYSEFRLLDDPITASSLRGKDLKVIVKAADYILRPGQEYKEPWHMEGLPHERVVASVVYSYDADQSMSDDGLAFRRFRDMTEDFPSISDTKAKTFKLFIKEPPREGQVGDVYSVDTDYPSDWEGTSSGMWGSRPIPATFIRGTVSLGTVLPSDGSTPGNFCTGQMLSFPNWVQKRMVSLKNCVQSEQQHSSPTARKRTLSFFLVNDDPIPGNEYNGGGDRLEYPGFTYHCDVVNTRIRSTMDVPFQGCSCNLATLSFLLTVGCQRLTGRYLPPELSALILSQMDFGVSRETAEGNRWAMVRDRNFRKPSHLDWPLSFPDY